MTPLTPVGQVILFAAMFVVFVAPRRWAPVPILLVTCYMVLSQGLMLGPFNFFSIRLVILAGAVRVLLRGEFRDLPKSPIDGLMAWWGVWALASSYFHVDPQATLTYNGGLVFNTFGAYMLWRVFCRTVDDVEFLCRVSALLLVPVALEMTYEKIAASNAFSILGGVPDVPNIREGRIRAQGPFAHSILAGTVGAVTLPICLGLWRRHRMTSITGAAASATIVLTSTSSGPLLSAIFSLIALAFWRYRHRMRMVRWLALFSYVFLKMVMEAPPYYLLARIDLSGGSTGYHRARLIESAIEHLGEWWFAGTDHTRHWMATGVSWSPDHTDITNHYLMLGVMGGLPLTLLFIAMLWKGFSIVGQVVQDPTDRWQDRRFYFWSLGASLFAHSATCISVSYFDQSFVFLYLTLACIASLGTQFSANLVTQQAAPPPTRSVRRSGTAPYHGELAQMHRRDERRLPGR